MFGILKLRSRDSEAENHCDGNAVKKGNKYKTLWNEKQGTRVPLQNVFGCQLIKLIISNSHNALTCEWKGEYETKLFVILRKHNIQSRKVFYFEDSFVTLYLMDEVVMK